ncbi:sensor of ECF-type sigma factor [Flavobacterium sp. CYK-4]|uniref:sensor of ECF-type sigma factor n=1 Tax=Flavobacterium lotistagni TaxID=2709660 RepID=UPI001407A82B|nr:sensor of ECF-type sigma factor [Flavobacterium lotistagni]NHM07061.1 sensor of ECF-type sigma factor [Flavobacterium lotistagni]
MKTYKIILPFLLLISTFGFSQGHMKQQKEKIKALKVAYITEELQLTSEEAAKFWPLYNAFDDKQKEFKQEKRRAYLDRMDGTEINKLTDKEATAMLSQIENNEEELYQLRKRFVASLKGVIPAIKIIKLKKAEEGFNRKLLQQYRNKFKD